MNKFLFTFIPLLLTLSFTSCKGKYKNYILSCMGDSITYGYIPKSSGTQMEKPYPTLLQERLGFGKVNNYGISGSTVSNGENSYCSMFDRITEIDKDSNIVIFWGGGNDMARGCDIGNEGDTNPNTLYGALYQCGTYMNNNFPKAFKMMMTTLPTTLDKGEYHIVSDAISYTANKLNIPLLDMYHNSGFEDEMYLPISDGVHPTQEFVKNIMVPTIYKFIKDNAKL